MCRQFNVQRDSEAACGGVRSPVAALPKRGTCVVCASLGGHRMVVYCFRVYMY